MQKLWLFCLLALGMNACKVTSHVQTTLPANQAGTTESIHPGDTLRLQQGEATINFIAEERDTANNEQDAYSYTDVNHSYALRLRDSAFSLVLDCYETRTPRSGLIETRVSSERFADDATAAAHSPTGWWIAWQFVTIPLEGEWSKRCSVPLDGTLTFHPKR